MDASRFDRLATRIHHLTTGLPAALSRRRLVQGLALGTVVGVASLGSEVATAKQRRCRKNGKACRNRSKKCKARYCLKEPFTIEAVWTNAGSDHDTYFFVPKQSGSTDPSPYIDYSCNPDSSDCATEYPFACVSQDATGPGDEVTTVYRLLRGKYEYWIEVESNVPAGDLTIYLRRNNGKLVRSWKSPANSSVNQRGWHVFDVNGSTGRVESVNGALTAGFLPDDAHDPNTDVCPV